MFRWAGRWAALGVLFWAATVAGSEALVDYRSEAMQAAHRHLKAIGAVALAPDAAPLRKRVDEHARALLVFAGKLPELFPPGSTAPYSDASPLIWQDWAGFQASARSLREAAARLSHASGDEALADAYDATLAACKACHRRYRER